MALPYLLRVEYANEHLRPFRNEQPPGAFLFTSFAFGFFQRKVTPAIGGVSAAYPMLSMAVVPAPSFEFFTSFAQVVREYGRT